MKDEKGKYRTQSLFWETRTRGETEERYPPLFTLKDREHQGLPSLKNIYLSYDHLPGQEYEFAMDVFGSWDHWERLAKIGLIRPYIAEWRKELEIKIRANAAKALLRNAFEDGPKGASSARYISEGGWKGNGRGRPSNLEVQRELHQQAANSQQLESDMERIGLKVVNGGRQ